MAVFVVVVVVVATEPEFLLKKVKHLMHLLKKGSVILSKSYSFDFH